VEANPADGEDSWDDDDYAMGDDQMSQVIGIWLTDFCFTVNVQIQEPFKY
jgi:hypothetical protein